MRQKRDEKLIIIDVIEYTEYRQVYLFRILKKKEKMYIYARS